MIDWHSHILPAMDDGSRDVSESLEMLRALNEQEINYVVATPHFYANKESLDSFLERRKSSYDTLSKSVDGSFPEVFLGAEIAYYPGISKMSGLELLKIENTDLLLLEMPISKWTEYTLKELLELAATRGLTLVIAHVDRCISLQSREVLKRLCYNGILMQVNASFFRNVIGRRKALKLLRDGMLHFIGSDCHNMTSRPPRIADTYDLIKRKFGGEFLSQMNQYGLSMLKIN